MLELLKELCRLNGVSGAEDPVRNFIQTQAQPYADSLRSDALGNLIVFKRGKKSTGNKLLLAAHMDEVGVIVTRITEEGFLKFVLLVVSTAVWPLVSRWSWAKMRFLD